MLREVVKQSDGRMLLLVTANRRRPIGRGLVELLVAIRTASGRNRLTLSGILKGNGHLTDVRFSPILEELKKREKTVQDENGRFRAAVRSAAERQESEKGEESDHQEEPD